MESCFKDLRSKKGPKKDHFSSLVLKGTKSLIKDLYASTANTQALHIPTIWQHHWLVVFVQSSSRYRAYQTRLKRENINLSLWVEHKLYLTCEQWAYGKDTAKELSTGWQTLNYFTSYKISFRLRGQGVRFLGLQQSLKMIEATHRTFGISLWPNPGPQFLRKKTLKAIEDGILL